MSFIALLTAVAILAAILFSVFYKYFAQDGTRNGPVAAAAKKALETEDLNFVLIWAHKQDEAEIKEAFQQTLAARRWSPETQELAEMQFVEAVCRIYRAGERSAGDRVSEPKLLQTTL